MIQIFHTVVGAVRTNCYFLSDSETRQCVVIDPGDSASKLLELLRSEGLEARYIFLTHGHFDHRLAAQALKTELNVPVAVHEADAGMLGFTPDIMVKGGESFEVGQLSARWLHTPGHTPGSCCIICENMLFSGDTLFEDDCGRCDLPGGDYGIMLRSLKMLAELPGDYTVYPGHDVSTTLERERRYNVNMREATAAGGGNLRKM